MTIYGYARVSTKEQNLERQIYALQQAGAEVIFEEKITGTKKERPELVKLLDTIEEGDTIVFAELTRLSRSTKDLLDLVEEISNKGAEVKSLKEAWLDTTTSHGKLMLTIFAGLSQFERDLLSERTKDGLESAKRRGKLAGRPKKNGDNMKYAIELFKEGGISIAEICRRTTVKRTTLYRRLEELGLK